MSTPSPITRREDDVAPRNLDQAPHARRSFCGYRSAYSKSHTAQVAYPLPRARSGRVGHDERRLRARTDQGAGKRPSALGGLGGGSRFAHLYKNKGLGEELCRGRRSQCRRQWGGEAVTAMPTMALKPAHTAPRRHTRKNCTNSPSPRRSVSMLLGGWSSITVAMTTS